MQVKANKHATARNKTQHQKNEQKNRSNEFFRTVNYICRQRATYTYHTKWLSSFVFQKRAIIVVGGKFRHIWNKDDACELRWPVRTDKNINNIKQFADF